jgi:hypothetical protein
MKRLGVLTSILLPLLTGCFDDPVAGGTVETENTVAARTISVDSLLSPWNRPLYSPTVATLRLDSSNIPFSKMSASGLDLAVERLEGGPLPFRVVVWDKRALLGRIQVHLEPSLQRKDSRFKLRWGLKDSIRADSQAVWSGISESQKLLLNSVLVDDFEDSSLKSPLPNTGWWYSSSTDSATVSSPRLVDAALNRTGRALQVTYSAPSSKSQYALLGLVLAARPRSLRTLDSMVFWARGPGNVSIAFDRFGPNVSKKAWLNKVLDSNWTRICIQPHQLDPAAPHGEDENVGWEGVRDSVTNLSFFLRGGKSFWIDDIRFYGVNRDDLQ